VTQLHSAHHAIAITSEAGVEVLLHIGLDTVMLKGEGFTAKVKLGDRVEAGQPLISFDPVLLGRKARSLLTQMVITNGERIASMQPAAGMVVVGKDMALHLLLREPTAEAAPIGGETVQSRVVIFRNTFGLHARPAAILAASAKKFQSVVRLLKGAVEVNAKSVVAILGFGVKEGDALQVKATGPDAREASETLANLLSEGCGETPKQGPLEPSNPESAPKTITIGPNELAGVPASPGLAVGHVFQYRPAATEVSEAGKNPAEERAHLEAALRDASLQIEAIKTREKVSADPTRAGILSAHQELLVDPDLTELAFAGITAGKSGAFAWREAFNSCAEKLGSLDSALLRERANDIRDVGRRVLRLLTGAPQAQLETPPDSVLIAEEITPSEAAQLDRTKVLGLCTTTGGPTGHMAILARSLGIPAICGIDKAALELPDQATVIVDGSKGILQRNPTEADLAEARKRIDAQIVKRAQDMEAAQKPAMTLDGFAIEVAANIRSAQEAREAIAAGAQGIGLLRSEFLFLDRETAPTEDEQAAEYCAVANILGPRRKLVIRTMDVGGDKPLTYLPLPPEDNPFLGLRGVRVSLDRPDLFRTQLRALLRAAPLSDVHIMFPMIATLEELRAAKGLLAEEAKNLGRTAKVGVMIEVPSAVLIADALAQEVDFFSIGTNDLTQYCMAMDRGHPKLAKEADALHPSVLKLIGLAVESAHRHGKWVGVCGGLASEVLAIPALLGLGVDELSVSVPAIGAVKARFSHLKKADCEVLARELLQLSTAGDIRQRLAILAE
jgi:phosphocarrier protein FPr/phosphocarrier protein